MKTHFATIERYKGDSWLVELSNDNWGFLHTEADGGRATLEAAIRSTIEKITGDKDFGVIIQGVINIDYEVVP